MKGLGTVVRSLSLLLSALLVITAALPAQFSNTTTSLLQLPNANDTSLDILSPRKIRLAFTALGEKIPKSEVDDTFAAAEQAIRVLIERRPEERIPNNRFEYRRKDGNMLILITANVGQEITWADLETILASLYRFMTGGPGVPDDHYQTLEFLIQALHAVNVGFGLIWYFPPALISIEKRAMPPPSMSKVEGVDLLARNVTGSMLGLNTTDEPIPYPVPRTSLLLDFYFLGIPIPPDVVKSALQGALAIVRPKLNDGHEHDTVTGGSYQYITQHESRGYPRVAVSIFTYHGRYISWKQLFDVLFGLFQFATAFNEQNLEREHYQILGFRIIHDELGKLGVGTISYYIPGKTDMAKRAQSSNEVFDRPAMSATEIPTPLQLPQLGRSTRVNSTGADSITSFLSTKFAAAVKWPIVNTDIVLTFTFFGDPIPPQEVSSTIRGAQQLILPILQHRPDQRITDDHFRYRSDDGLIAISVLAYQNKVITWVKLSQILAGMLQFCMSDHNRVLVFEIDIGEQRVGFATFLYARASPAISAVDKRVWNNSVSSQPNAAISPPRPVGTPASIPFPVLFGGDNFLFTELGPAIPPFKLRIRLDYALREIRPMVDGFPDEMLYSGYYEVKDENVIITVGAMILHDMTWLQLDHILIGLRDFITGSGSISQTHYQVLELQVDRPGEGGVAYGSVRYPVSITHVQRRASNATPSLPVEIEKRLQNVTLASPHVAILSSSIPYPIPGTPVTLIITSLGDPIPSLELGAGLTTALRRISPSVANRAQTGIPDNKYWYRDDISHLWFHVLSWSSRQIITWQQLSRTMAGLLQWMRDDRCRELSFEIKVEGQGMIGFGSLGHDPIPSRTFPGVKNLEKRADLTNETSTNTLSLLAYGECIYIPDTEFDLCFRQYGAPIPASQIGLLYNLVYHDLSSSEEIMPGSSYSTRTPASIESGQTSIDLEWIPFYEMSYNVLRRVMYGLHRYMLGYGSGPSASSHLQSLLFVLRAEESALGSGKIWHVPAGHGLEKRAIASDGPLLLLNTTSTPALQAVEATAPYAFPIVDTPITLLFFYFGMSIPGYGIEAVSTLRSALSKIISKVETVPEDPITNNSFRFSKRFGPMKILVAVHTLLGTSHTISWRDLDAVLDGLAWFMQRDPDSGYPCNQGSNFQINVAGTGTIGQGTLWWTSSTGVTEKRAGIINSSLQSHNLSLSLPETHFAFPVRGTPITLIITFLARPINGIGKEASLLLLAALHHIESLVDRHAELPITNNFFEVKKVFDSPAGRLTIRVRTQETEDISWQDLQNILDGLNQFYVNDPATGGYRDWPSRFQVNKAGIGIIGQGILTFLESSVA